MAQEPKLPPITPEAMKTAVPIGEQGDLPPVPQPNLKTGAGMEFPAGAVSPRGSLITERPVPKIGESLMGKIHRSYAEHPYAELEGAAIGLPLAMTGGEIADVGLASAARRALLTGIGGVGGSAAGGWVGGEIAGEPGRKVGRVAGGLAGGYMGIRATAPEDIPYWSRRMLGPRIMQRLFGPGADLTATQREAMSEVGVTDKELEIAKRYYGAGGPGATLSASEREALHDPHDATVAKDVAQKLSSASPETLHKLGMEETLMRSGIRPQSSEVRATQLVRKPILSPAEAKEESALLSRAKMKPSEGLMDRESRLLGTIRSRRAARGMTEPE